MREGLRISSDGWDLCQELRQRQPPTAVWGHFGALGAVRAPVQGCPAQTVKMRENRLRQKTQKHNNFLPNYERDAALLYLVL